MNDSSTKCPYCLKAIFAYPTQKIIGSDGDGESWGLFYYNCPACKKLVVLLISGVCSAKSGKIIEIHKSSLVKPKSFNRFPLAPEIPEVFIEDYKEACLVLNDSPKASAALSRRCLQNLLREKAGIERGNLADEIQQVLDSKQLPTNLAESIDYIRNIGNFGAHPEKSKSSGEIVDVEPGEAEWNLDVLEELFDFYFVRPAIIKKKRGELNKKLKDLGKPDMK